MKKSLLRALFAAPLLFGLVSGAVAWAEGDPFMGDWQGERTTRDGAKVPLVAQVIALGNGEYQANLMAEFDTRGEVFVAQGKQDGDTTVVFTGCCGWEGRIDGDTFSGSFKEGDTRCPFTMANIERLSPTLGLQPPEGAVVLFDGTSTGEWEHPDMRNWLVDLKKATGGNEQCTAYLRTQVWLPNEQRVRMELGTDDGVKVWTNGEVVHENNLARGCQPGNDKVHMKLNQGWNTVMMKVTQGTADWAVCAQFRPLIGDKIEGIKVSPTGSDADALTEGAAHDYILDWEVAGPYVQDGVDGLGLMAVPFPPEDPNAADVPWKKVSAPRGPMDRTCRWKLVEDGAMEVYFGSAYSKKTFGDHELHIEFRTPFMPDKRGQARGNSGVYVQGRYEVQVLDSYGLSGEDNECGGIYKNAKPLVNMCAPPLQWQTYDITFHQAQVDAEGKVTQKARITVIHNGVVIHDNLEVDTTPGGCTYDMAKPGPVYLQDHGNPVRFRNIWVKPL